MDIDPDTLAVFTGGRAVVGLGPSFGAEGQREGEVPSLPIPPAEDDDPGDPGPDGDEAKPRDPCAGLRNTENSIRVTIEGNQSIARGKTKDGISGEDRRKARQAIKGARATPGGCSRAEEGHGLLR